MADSEKLTALKKAYAEIILNTAKEAAARIMVSERKVVRYQKELVGAKDEALRMLLRLKQMLDSKVMEAEMTSVNQQRKIDELEAQLQEAEDIVRDLREELREAQDELEKVSNNQPQLCDEQNLRGGTGIPEEESRENGFNIAGSLISPQLQVQPVTGTTADTRNSTLNETLENIICCNSNGSHVNNCYTCNPDFTSMVMRSKEPELYRNGCTQRIRAFESNLSDGEFSVSGQVNDMKSEAFIRGDEGSKKIFVTPTLNADNILGVEKNSADFKTIQVDSSPIKVRAMNSSRRKRKRATRYKKSKAPSRQYIPDQVIETRQVSDQFCSGNTQVGEDSCQIIENEDQKDPESHLARNLNPATTKLIRQSRCSEVTENGAEFIKACSVRDTVNNNKVSIDDLVLKRRENGSAVGSEVPACITDVDTVVSIAKLDPEVADFTDDVPSSQPVDNKFLKYTFRRKRKKESLSSHDGNSSLDINTSRRKTGEKQTESLEPQKSSLISESSRDSRRLAQVARQLISLSEKKWW